MSYWNVNQQIKSINATDIRNALQNMSTIETFVGKIAYDANHSNPNFEYYAIQYTGGETSKFLNITSDLIYPAPFHWLQKRIYYGSLTFFQLI
jgi:hypothetical protein